MAISAMEPTFTDYRCDAASYPLGGQPNCLCGLHLDIWSGSSSYVAWFFNRLRPAFAGVL